MKQAIGMMSALAQPTRLRVAAVLGGEYPGGLPVGELASRMDTPPNTMSNHLAILSRAGLVVARRSGRIVEYSADRDALRGLAAFLVAQVPDGRSGARD